MAHVNSMVLSECLGNYEKDCLKDADALYLATKKLLRVLGAEDARLCRICRLGLYVGDGGAIVEGCFHFHCRVCGHVIRFQHDDGLKLPSWVKALADEQGVVG